MISVIVQRGAGDNQGQDISDALISTEEVAIQRGRVEIDRQYTDRVRMSGTTPLISSIKPTAIVGLSDIENGVTNAMVRSFAVSVSVNAGTISAMANIVIEREP